MTSLKTAAKETNSFKPIVQKNRKEREVGFIACLKFRLPELLTCRERLF